MTDPTPNIPFIRDQWIPALRSGQYKQGHGLLHEEDRFCCLGVAADRLQQVSAIDAGWESLGNGGYTLLGEWGCLPTAVRLVIGLTGDEQETLIDLNDDDGKTFPEIANYIEAEILAPALAADGAQ